jgi:hypothetical protein
VAVAGQHDRPAVRLEGVKGVQELLLRGSLGGQEVQIVQEEGVAAAKVLAEAGQLAQPHRLDEAVGEVLARDEADEPVRPGPAEPDVDPLQQVRLAGPDRAVQHQRAGPLAGGLDHAQRRGVRHPVASPDHELTQAPPPPRPLRPGARRLHFGGGRARRDRGRPRGGQWSGLLRGGTMFRHRPRARRVGGRGGRRGRGWLGGPVLLRLGLLAAGGLEQLRVDGEPDFERLAEHFAGGGRDGRAEGLLEPLLEVPVGDADRQPALPPGELGVPLEPELVARLADPPGDGPAHGRRDVALAADHGIPPARSRPASVGRSGRSRHGEGESAGQEGWPAGAVPRLDGQL